MATGLLWQRETNFQNLAARETSCHWMERSPIGKTAFGQHQISTKRVVNRS